MQNNKKHLKDYLDMEFNLLKKEINEREKMFKKQVFEFLSNRFEKHIDSQIKTKFSEEGLREQVKYQIKQNLNSYEIKEIVKSIIVTVLDRLNRNMNEELNRTKKIAYSIDCDLKKIYRELPLNTVDSEKVMLRISDVLDKIKIKEEKEIKLIR